MVLDRKEFLEKVRMEIEHLRRNATPEEKNKLNFKTFDPFNTSCCIYGQMTGYCSSTRAKKLMEKQLDELTNSDLYNNKSLIQANKGDLFSFLETYITSVRSKEGINKGILEYIKGESDELNLV